MLACENLRRAGLDAEGRRIYQRMTEFPEALLVATVEGQTGAG